MATESTAMGCIKTISSMSNSRIKCINECKVTVYPLKNREESVYGTSLIIGKYFSPSFFYEQDPVPPCSTLMYHLAQHRLDFRAPSQILSITFPIHKAQISRVESSTLEDSKTSENIRNATRLSNTAGQSGAFGSSYLILIFDSAHLTNNITINTFHNTHESFNLVLYKLHTPLTIKQR